MHIAFHFGLQFRGCDHASFVSLCFVRTRPSHDTYIMWIRRGLRNKDLRSAFDEMMAPNVGHQLRTWQNLLAELLLDRVELLSSRQQYCLGSGGRCAYRFIIVHLHLGELGQSSWGELAACALHNFSRSTLCRQGSPQITTRRVKVWVRPPCAGWRFESQLSRLEAAGSTKIWGGKGERETDYFKQSCAGRAVYL